MKNSSVSFISHRYKFYFSDFHQKKTRGVANICNMQDVVSVVKKKSHNSKIGKLQHRSKKATFIKYKHNLFYSGICERKIRFKYTPLELMNLTYMSDI